MQKYKFTTIRIEFDKLISLNVDFERLKKVLFCRSNGERIMKKVLNEFFDFSSKIKFRREKKFEKISFQNLDFYSQS